MAHSFNALSQGWTACSIDSKSVSQSDIHGVAIKSSPPQKKQIAEFNEKRVGFVWNFTHNNCISSEDRWKWHISL